jgi:hypothetical protein
MPCLRNAVGITALRKLALDVALLLLLLPLLLLLLLDLLLVDAARTSTRSGWCGYGAAAVWCMCSCLCCWQLCMDSSRDGIWCD